MAGGSAESAEVPSQTKLYLEPTYCLLQPRSHRKSFNAGGAVLKASLALIHGVQANEPVVRALSQVCRNGRFAREEHYEWFKDYSHFRHLILSHIKVTDRVLEVGCGNSHMGEEIYKDGITRITRTDLSPVVINLMQKRSLLQGCQGIEYKVADVLDLPFDDHSFDVIIEKGTVDCLFVDSGDPWNPKPDVAKRVRKMLEEAHRVLTPTGLFISIAFGQPHFRRPFFEAKGFTWSMKWETFGDSFHYFFYNLRKGTKASHEGPSVPHPSKVNTRFDLEHEFMDNEDYLLHSMIGDGM